MSSAQFKYLLAGAAGIAVIAIGAFSYFNKPKTPTLDLDKSAADSKPPRGLELSSDKLPPTPSRDGVRPGSPTAAKGGAASSAQHESPRPETPPPARRVPPETPAHVATPRAADPPAGGLPSASPGDPAKSLGDLAKPSSDATRSPGEATLTARGPESSLPPIGGSAASSVPPGEAGAGHGRTGTDKPQVPEATPISESPRTDARDAPRGATPPSGATGEILRPGGPAVTPGADNGRSSGRRSIRDTELDSRTPGSGGLSSASGAAAASKPPSAADGRRAGAVHTIASGDTLAKIAMAHYGDEAKWTEIKKANPGLDEHRLKVGTKLTLPPVGDASPARPVVATEPGGATTAKSTAGAAPASETHKVVAGDTLRKIARAVLNDERRWREIYELNSDRLKNPDRLEEGMVLKLPAAKPSTSRRSADTAKPR